MGSTAGIFSGSSRYASDFRSIIDRSVAIASLPMLQMQNDGNLLRSRSDALSKMDSKVAGLQTALTNLESALKLNSYRSTVSDGSIVSATVADGVQEASYTIEVTGLGSNTVTVSKAPGGGLTQVSNPSQQGIGATGPFKLYINTTDDAEAITVAPQGATLNDLVNAVNAASPDVRATVVNMGGSGGADYRLTIQHTKFGANTIDLKDDTGTSVLDTVLPPGSPVTYKLNGSSEISNDTRTITVAPGLTLNLLKQSSPGIGATVAVSRSGDAAKNALASFVQAYNALVEELDIHRGQGTGALKADSILSSIGDSVRQITGYSNPGETISSLTALGLSFDDKGKLSLDAVAFQSAAADFSELADFLGSPGGGGFLGTASDVMKSLQDATSGILKTGLNTVQSQIRRQDDRIAAEQARIDEMKAGLERQIAATDALIAALEQQVRYFDGMFESMRIAAQTYK